MAEHEDKKPVSIEEKQASTDIDTTSNTCPEYWVRDECPGFFEIPHSMVHKEKTCLKTPCKLNAEVDHAVVPPRNSISRPVPTTYFEDRPGKICFACRVREKQIGWKQTLNMIGSSMWKAAKDIAEDTNLPPKSKRELLEGMVGDESKRLAEKDLCEAGLGPDEHGR